MIQPIPQETQAEGASTMPSGQAISARRSLPDGIGRTGTLLTPEAAPDLTGHEPIVAMLRPAHAANIPQQPPLIAIEDWDALFCAVQTQLKHAVGEQLGTLPLMPTHPVELAATLVQAIVLDCVGAMDQLHTALKQERCQRSMP
jgi:hypothetical protein